MVARRYYTAKECELAEGRGLCGHTDRPLVSTQYGVHAEEAEVDSGDDGFNLLHVDLLR